MRKPTGTDDWMEIRTDGQTNAHDYDYYILHEVDAKMDRTPKSGILQHPKKLVTKIFSWPMPLRQYMFSRRLDNTPDLVKILKLLSRDQGVIIQACQH